ncbi:MAG TPA: phage holin family protein [Candidatus Melainabacteria bacterium]|nr:phage holin family protein [Candidatus Melainabacteria bacterium]
MLEFLIALVLKVVVLLVVVPAVTSGNVAVRQGGFFRGLLILLSIGLLNLALWPLLSIFTLGTILVAQMAIFGLVGLVVNALAFRIAGGMSDAFYVKNFGSALGAALTMSVANIVIQMLL